MHALFFAPLLSIGPGLALEPVQDPVQEPVRQEQINAAIDRGRAFLEKSYEQTLARGNLGAVERVGQSALSLYTLLKAGADPQGDLARRLLLEISLAEPDQTYDVACTLLALGAHDAIANRPWIDELADQLVAWQTDDGDWSYPAGLSDLSNTQYAALGLWAASRAGYEVSPDVWSRLAGSTLRYLDGQGGFGYSPGTGRGSSGTGSMTAAGVGTLAICETRLRRAGKLSELLGKQLANAREGGLSWLAKHFSVETNPRSGAWHYYYLYGLERLGAFVGTPRIETHDWYDEGAAWLVRAQTEKGSWNNGSDLSETCFALLFLRRATAFDAPRTGPLTGAAAQADDGAPLRIEAEGDGPVTFSLAGWSKKEMQTLEWPGERGLGPHVVCVEYWVDGELAAVEIGSPARPSTGSRFRTTHVFASAGKHKLRARATLVAPDGSRPVLESAELEVEVARALPAWLAQPRLAADLNLLPKMKASAKASSVAKGESAPFGATWGDDYAIDGNPRTPWLAAEKDDKRQLSITLGKGEKCAVIQVRAAVLAPLGPKHLSRPVSIEVSVNGKPRGQLAMSPDPLQPMRLVLDEPLVVRRIDLTITALVAGEGSPLVGIGEVELFAPDTK